MFIDFAHACDYISQECVVATLRAFDFPESFIGLIEMLMKNQTGRVIVNGDLSPEFNVNNGGKQGDPLFPLMHIIALQPWAFGSSYHQQRF